MGLFDRIFRPKDAINSIKALREAKKYFGTLTAYEPVFHSWRGAIYEYELVRAAIDARARHISKLKADIHGTAQLSLQSKLKQGPNQWQTWSQFLYRVSTILDNQSTCFIAPVFDADMRITGYYPLLPEKCSIVEYEGEAWLKYAFSRGQVAAVELRKCGILTKFQYKSDFFGTNNDALDDIIKLVDIQRQGIKLAVKNSQTYRFMAQLTNFSKHDDLVSERDRFTEENFSKDAKGGGLLLFPNTYKDIQQIKTDAYTIDASQMEYIRTNVYNYFGVNENILQNKAKSDELDAFFNGAIEPFAIQFSEVMTKAIFSERERAQGSRFVANANRLQYMTVNEKVAMVQQLLDRGVMSINEARELFNYEDVDGGDLRTIRGEYKDASDLDTINVIQEGKNDE